MSKENHFYITTPIYYTNGIPHIGHAYSSIIADIIFRYNKISGKKVKFTTGVDENSQKAIQIAEEKGMDIMEYLNLMAGKHKGVWDGLGIEYTDFIRTTEKRHHKFVRKVLQKSYDAGDIYAGIYKGMYCVGCEAFKKDDDLIIKEGKKVCPDHLKEPDLIKEKNYFFKLSKYEDKLLEFYKKNPEFVIPTDRFNEVKAFVKRGLDDFSVSRETNNFGIKLPFDEEQVTYVWYDALFNYLTVCQNGGEDFWSADLHIVGKDIIRFHAIYWPAMLMSIGYELPKQILTTGFLTVDGQKISKTLGNVIDPVKFSSKYSKDLFTLYLLLSFNIGYDGNFDQHQAILTYNAKLANNLGNLVNRVVVLTLKLKDTNNLFIKDEVKILKNYVSDFDDNISKYNLKGILDNTFKFLDELNKYIDLIEPWKLIKKSPKEAKTALYIIAEGLRQVGLSLYSFFPEKMGEMFNKLGLENYVEQLENGKLKKLREKKEIFIIKEKGKNLYDRFEV